MQHVFLCFPGQREAHSSALRNTNDQLKLQDNSEEGLLPSSGQFRCLRCQSGEGTKKEEMNNGVDSRKQQQSHRAVTPVR